MSVARKNHYVPAMYLKRFETPPGHVLTYPILVGHQRVPLWTRRSIKGIGRRAHLYTRVVVGGQTDDLERWFNEEFETPAEEALRKATEGVRLTPSDWRRLIQFLAAQDVRTPARLFESNQRWKKEGPEFLDKTLRRSLQKLEIAAARRKKITSAEGNDAEYLPVRVTTTSDPDQKTGYVKAEMIIGRDLRLFGIRRLLTKTVDVLLQQKWSILISPDELEWFTSDDPVVRLNYYGEKNYDFKGGWGKRGTEIFLPLSPRHLLYAKIGHPRPARGTVIPRGEADMIRGFIAQHAHRYIFSRFADPEIPKLRPRTVDAQIQIGRASCRERV